MRAILRVLGSRWFLSGIGVALLALLVWWFGPFLTILDGWIARLVTILVMVLIWAGVNLLLDWRRRKRETALVAGVTAATPDAGETASAEEAAAMREKLSSALALLKKASGSRGYLYEQPWYAIIGPPGTGKTTALRNAGLHFPLAGEMGLTVAGVGGTRMCDWWFTENAVLIDTAGRYTTQQDSAVDKAGWDTFLDMLRRTRARQPLNGLVVVFSLQDDRQPDTSIGGASQAKRSEHAAAIRRRIKDVYERLGVRVPVYAVFTKTDLMAGFMDFFADLDREKLTQVWGMTFPLGQTGEDLPNRFTAEFDLLMQQINERLLRRLQDERGADRRVAIAGFPPQMASMREPLTAFIREAFGGSRLDPAPLLRGVYFSSGTQEGTPIDRLTATIARGFGIDTRRAASLVPEQGRSYFLTRLLKDVIFGEATLVSRDPAAVRRGWLLRMGAAATAVVITLAGVGALLQTRSANMDAIARTDAAEAAYVATAKPLPLDPVADSDLTKVLPALDQARAIPFGTDHPDDTSQWFPGLSQTGKLSAGAGTLYRHSLDNILLPRLVLRLEGQMRQNFNQPAFLYEATRVYLMLTSNGPLDRGSITEWMQADWATAWPGMPGQDTRDRLARHLAALLEGPMAQVPADGALVEDARRTFSRVSLADRVYAAIRRSPQAVALAPWRPGDAAGASGVRAFQRRSGKPLTEGVAGIFTVEGLYRVLLPQVPTAAKQAASESWVLGSQAEVSTLSPKMLTLQNDVVALYLADYGKEWDALMDDLDLQPLGNPQQAAQSLYILSSPQSPMRDLLAGMTRQFSLTTPPPAEAAAQGALAQAAGAAGGAASAAASRLTGMFTGGASGEPPGKPIETKYAALIAFVGKGPGAPIDNVLKLMDDLKQQMERLANTSPGAPPAPPTGGDPAALLRAEAARLPQPVQRWLAGISGGAATIRSGGAKKGAGEAFNAPGGPASLCKQAVAGRYPFDPKSPNDIPIDDFARLFAPNGMIDQFFTAQLRPFVDMSGQVWKAQEVAGVAPPVSPGDLAQFQRAAAIRDLFFAGGAATPTVRFDLVPTDLDSGAKQVTLDLETVSLSNAHGPPRPVSVTWPGTGARINSARLVFDPAPSSGPPVLQDNGPWALFRLFGRGTLQQAGSSDRYTLTFSLADRKAVFEIRAGSVLNPFAPGMLRDFKCPAL